MEGSLPVRSNTPIPGTFPSGLGGRILMLSASTLIGGGFATALLVVGVQEAGDASWLLIGVSAPLLGCYFWAWIRVWRVGATIRDHDVTFTSWSGVQTIAKEDVERWSAEPYSGFFSVVGWPVAGGFLQPGELLVDLADGSRHRVPGTATLRTTAREQARFLNDWSRR